MPPSIAVPDCKLSENCDDSGGRMPGPRGSEARDIDPGGTMMTGGRRGSLVHAGTRRGGGGGAPRGPVADAPAAVRGGPFA